MNFAQCRAMGHSWQHRQRPVNDADDLGWSLPTGAEYGSVGLVSSCSNCGAKRTKWIGRSGSRGPVRYDYPEGYQTHGEGLQVLDWRRSFVVRAFAEWS